MTLTGARIPRKRRRAGVAAATAATMAAGLLLSVSLPATAAVPTGWTEVARDSFTRTLSGSWGKADLGGSYATSVTSGSTVSTSGSAGLATLREGHKFSATLSAVSARDVYLADSVKLTSSSSIASDILHGWNVRTQGDGSAYSTRIRFSSSGTTSLGVSRLNGGTSTWLGGVKLPFKVSAGQSVRGEVQVTGTSPIVVKARAYLVGSPVPAWQVEHSDTSAARLQPSGSVGVWDHAQVASSPVTLSHDDLSVASAPTTAEVADVPTTAVTSTAGRGALPIGTANYPIPTGALFVDGARGSDANSGSQSSPVRTVGAAVARASSGKSIVIRAGVYHESVTVPSTKSLTIQSYPKEAVWFDGSTPIRTWTKSGTVWVASGWTAEFSSTMGDTTLKSRMIGSNPMAADPDQVFVNGTQLTQVGSSSSVTAGKFYVNDAANTITIGTDPTGKDVRASDLAVALHMSGVNSVVQGIGFRRYATGYERRGTVRLGNSGGAVRNVVIVDNAAVGLAMSNVTKVVDRVTIERNGMLGIGGHQNDNSVIKNSIVSNNNTQNFKDAPVAGGIKLTAARTATIANVEARNNLGTGIWFDVSSYNMTIVNNVATGNRKHQIEVEISDKGIIANNVATGGEDGIILFNAGNFKVFNNEVGGSSLFGIKLAQDGRRQATHADGRDTRRPVPDSTVPWITRNVVLSNNVFGNGGYFQLYALDGKTRIAVDHWNLTVTGNLFNKRVVKSDPTMVAWGKGDNVTLERYESPAALAAAKNGAWRNAQTTSSKTLAAMSADKIAFVSVAIPLPTDVASATGMTAGIKRLGVG